MTLIDELEKLIDITKENYSEDIIEKLRDSEQDDIYNIRDVYEFFKSEHIKLDYIHISIKLKIEEKIRKKEIVDNYLIDIAYGTILAEFIHNDLAEEIINGLLDKYKTSPVFHLIKVRFLYRKKKYEEALDLIFSNLDFNRIGEGSCLGWSGRGRYIFKDFMDELKSKNDIDEVQRIFDKYKDKDVFSTTNFRDSIKEFLIEGRFEKQIKQFQILEQKTKQLFDDYLQKERSNYIQLLGIFSGIVAFIISTISNVVKVNSANMMILFISLMTISLIAMLLTVNILFGEEKNKNLKIGILIFLITLLFLFFLISYLGIFNVINIIASFLNLLTF